MSVYRDTLKQLRQSFAQPVSDPVHDGYVVFSILRALDQVDKMKSQAPILGAPRAPDYPAARRSRLADEHRPLEEVVPELVGYLEGMLVWGHPRNQVNVVCPPSLASVIGGLLPSLYNPNLVSDETSGRFSEVEMRASSMAAELVGYDPEKCSGVFTFGGTGTLLYAAKVGLEKASPGTLRSGLREPAVILASDASHYACFTVAAWLGLGQDNLRTVATHADNSIDLAALEAEARRAIEAGEKIACIVATMGSTDAFGVDDLQGVCEIRDRLVDEFKLEYQPHIHADAVIGWAWSVFDGYDYDDNVLEFRGRTVRALAAAASRIRRLNLADSIGIDFHKTGYVPYISSLVLFRDGGDFRQITRDRETMPYLFQSGQWHPGKFTLETSRAGAGAMAALANLLLLGREGLQILIGHSVEMAEVLRELIGAREHLSVINRENVGPVTLFRAYPDDVDTFRIQHLEQHDPQGRELLLAHNEFNRKVYERVHEQALRGEGVAISMTDCYRKTDYGEPIVALKSYVLTPFCDETEMNLVVEHVSAAREAVEAEG
jgi:glutamate/tyrosine decarboxylase-like PLP-dependent enzyme